MEYEQETEAGFCFVLLLLLLRETTKTRGLHGPLQRAGAACAGSPPLPAFPEIVTSADAFLLAT